MQQFARASLLLAAGVLTALLTASCSDDTDARLAATQPSGISMSTVKVVATSATTSAEPVDDPACPAVAPFKVPLGVVITGNGSSTAVITSIRAQFTDTTGRQAPPLTIPMPPVTLPAPGPIAQPGVATTAVFERTFPFVFGIGCGTGTTGTVIIVVEGSDHRGRRFSQQATVAVQ